MAVPGVGRARRHGSRAACSRRLPLYRRPFLSSIPGGRAGQPDPPGPFLPALVAPHGAGIWLPVLRLLRAIVVLQPGAAQPRRPGLSHRAQTGLCAGNLVSRLRRLLVCQRDLGPGGRPGSRRRLSLRPLPGLRHIVQRQPRRNRGFHLGRL
jgi:hypothetical protein